MLVERRHGKTLSGGIFLRCVLRFADWRLSARVGAAKDPNQQAGSAGLAQHKLLQGGATPLQQLHPAGAARLHAMTW